MKPLNYASLEASRRLVEAGIVLETEKLWYEYNPTTLVSLRDAGKEIPRPYLFDRRCIPAPTMAEVWRELPYGANVQKLMTNYARDHKENVEFESDNPTDALIDLLIWVRKEQKP